jgi:glucan-binding YG repeat protein
MIFDLEVLYMADIATVEARIKRLVDELKDARKDRVIAKTTQKKKDAKAQNKKDILYAIYRRSLHEDEYKRDISSSDFDNFLTRNYDRVFFGLPPLPLDSVAQLNKAAETQSNQNQSETKELSQTEEHVEDEAPTGTEVENKSPETGTEEQHTTTESNHSLLVKQDEPETPAIADLPWKLIEGQMRLYIKSEYRERDKIVRTAKSVFGEESRGTHFDFDKVRRQWYFIKTETDYDLTPFSDWPPVADVEDE